MSALHLDFLAEARAIRAIMTDAPRDGQARVPYVASIKARRFAAGVGGVHQEANRQVACQHVVNM